VEFLDQGDARLEMLAVEIAETDSTRQRGLMDRRSLPRRGGMILVFEDEDVRTFDMNNIPIELDFIFINSDSEVISVVTSTRPLSDQEIRSDEPSKYVIKANVGFADRHGINTDSNMRLRRR
jgi:uncharacterized membrane protein (UPF0127 family)